MPYEWDIKPRKAPVNAGAFAFEHGDGTPLARLHLWPYRSLPRRSFVGIIGLAFVGFIIPLAAFIGTTLLWGLLPFAMATLWLLWFFIDKSYRDGEIIEELTIWSDHIHLSRTGPKRRVQDWQANPYWVRLKLHRTNGPVKNYITLKGNERDVELGAFLDANERPELYRALLPILAASKPGGPTRIL